MKLSYIIGLLLLFFAAPAIAEQSSVQAAAARFNKGVKWRQSSVVVGDFSCRGRPEQAILGASKDSVVIAVFIRGLSKPPELLRYLAPRDPRSAVLAVEDLDFDPKALEREVGDLPTGLRPSKSCKGLNLSDGRIDSAHIYWNSDEKRFSYWTAPAAPLECAENLERVVRVEHDDSPETQVRGTRNAMGLRVFETTVTGTSFTMGALVRNRSSYRYLIRKNGAELYFTKYADGRIWESVLFSERNYIATVPISITSWEDGESPALRLEPCQEKWIRFQGKIEGAVAVKVLSTTVDQVSISLYRLVDSGWGAGPSYTDTIDGPNFLDPLLENCRNTPGCGR